MPLVTLQDPPAPPSLPDQPPPPPPPALPGRPTAITATDGSFIVQIPTSLQEFHGLEERREILRDQMQRANNRRDELVRDLARDGEGALTTEARVGVQQRLQVLDERIVQLERDIARTEQALSNTPAAILSEARAEQPVYRPGTVDEDEAIGWSMFMFVFGIAATFGFSRFRAWRRRRRDKKLGINSQLPTGATDPRIDRLNEAVDAIAEEVERIGEGQRFVTQLLAQRQEQSALQQGSVQTPYRP